MYIRVLKTNKLNIKKEKERKENFVLNDNQL